MVMFHSGVNVLIKYTRTCIIVKTVKYGWSHSLTGLSNDYTHLKGLTVSKTGFVVSGSIANLLKNVWDKDACFTSDCFPSQFEPSWYFPRLSLHLIRLYHNNMQLPYNRKYWRSLNLEVWYWEARIIILADLNLAVLPPTAYRAIHIMCMHAHTCISHD